MFQGLFSWLRGAVKRAVLAGVEDAIAAVQAGSADLNLPEPNLLPAPAQVEPAVASTNGHTRRKVLSS